MQRVLLDALRIAVAVEIVNVIAAQVRGEIVIARAVKSFAEVRALVRQLDKSGVKRRLRVQSRGEKEAGKG